MTRQSETGCATSLCWHRNVRITAVRKLAVEAADKGLLAPELAAGITRVKGAASKGVRVGNWLSVQQAQKLLNAPDVTTKKGLRDRAMLAVLLGCGLRRSEVAALTLKHIQQRDNRWCIVDLLGKHGRVRTIPIPTWVKSAIDAWTSGAGVAEGNVLRPVNRGDQITGEPGAENGRAISRDGSVPRAGTARNEHDRDHAALSEPRVDSVAEVRRPYAQAQGASRHEAEDGQEHRWIGVLCIRARDQVGAGRHKSCHPQRPPKGEEAHRNGTAPI
jgi:integrase